MSSKIFYLLLLFFIPILFVQNSKAPEISTKLDAMPTSKNVKLIDSLYKTAIEFDSIKIESKIKIRILHDQQKLIKNLNNEREY